MQSFHTYWKYCIKPFALTAAQDRWNYLLWTYMLVKTTDSDADHASCLLVHLYRTLMCCHNSQGHENASHIICERKPICSSTEPWFEGTSKSTVLLLIACTSPHWLRNRKHDYQNWWEFWPNRVSKCIHGKFTFQDVLVLWPIIQLPDSTWIGWIRLCYGRLGGAQYALCAPRHPVNILIWQTLP